MNYECNNKFWCSGSGEVTGGMKFRPQGVHCFGICFETKAEGKRFVTKAKIIFLFYPIESL